MVNDFFMACPYQGVFIHYFIPLSLSLSMSLSLSLEGPDAGPKGEIIIILHTYIIYTQHQRRWHGGSMT